MSQPKPVDFQGLIMSGGGTKGFCALGSLQYLYDNNFISPSKLNCFSGTSIGGIISFFMAIGYTPIELMVYLCSHEVMESIKINPLNVIFEENGLYNYSNISEHCKKMIIEKIGFIPTLNELFEKFQKDLTLCTYNLTMDKVEYLSYRNYPDLSCLDAIRMTSNLPFIFGEFFYNDCEYLDGGIVDNFPLRGIPNNSEIQKIGIFLGHKKKESLPKESDNLWTGINKVVDKVYNILNIPMNEREIEKIEEYVNDSSLKILKIEPENMKIYKFNLSQHEKLELFSLGYNKAKEHFLLNKV